MRGFADPKLSASFAIMGLLSFLQRWTGVIGAHKKTCVCGSALAPGNKKWHALGDYSVYVTNYTSLHAIIAIKKPDYYHSICWLFVPCLNNKSGISRFRWLHIKFQVLFHRSQSQMFQQKWVQPIFYFLCFSEDVHLIDTLLEIWPLWCHKVNWMWHWGEVICKSCSNGDREKIRDQQLGKISDFFLIPLWETTILKWSFKIVENAIKYKEYKFTHGALHSESKSFIFKRHFNFVNKR